MVQDALGRHRSVARAAGELGVTRLGLAKLRARLQLNRFDRQPAGRSTSSREVTQRVQEEVYRSNNAKCIHV